MPSDLQLKTMNLLHKTMLTLSFGKIGWQTAGMPVLKLTTTGRKSGEARTVMLTSPVQVGETIVIVASKGGEDHHPAWYLNLLAKPDVQVEWKGGAAKPMVATVATAEQKAELWPKIVAAYKGYGGYQRKTEREIPLVFLNDQA
ncbi:MAG: nitroreductase family deazaflavin-dependent oxidoreductase [Actinobacteria bacterium]|nr:nitroreductase family deazaflavin-dependent oxidoreductase [Actinomycetota bacterium]